MASRTSRRAAMSAAMGAHGRSPGARRLRPFSARNGRNGRTSGNVISPPKAWW